MPIYQARGSALAPGCRANEGRFTYEDWRPLALRWRPDRRSAGFI